MRFASRLVRNYSRAWPTPSSGSLISLAMISASWQHDQGWSYTVFYTLSLKDGFIYETKWTGWTVRRWLWFLIALLVSIPLFSSKKMGLGRIFLAVSLSLFKQVWIGTLFWGHAVKAGLWTIRSQNFWGRISNDHCSTENASELFQV